MMIADYLKFRHSAKLITINFGEIEKWEKCNI